MSDAGVWVKLEDAGSSGELPGLGGWANITSVTGNPTRIQYPDLVDSNFTWVAFEWKVANVADATFTVSTNNESVGLVDSLVVGGGVAHTGTPCFAGRVNAGVILCEPETYEVTVGQQGKPYNLSGPNCTYSSIERASDSKALVVAMPGEAYNGSFYTNGHLGAHAEPNALPLQGFKSSINGREIEYGKGYDGANANPGDPGDAGKAQPTTHNAGDGAVIIRVPAANAEKVSPGSWVTRSNYFAVVENGVVTETYTEHHYGNGTTTPLPQTDLIPCDANVTEGYSYENGEFVAPPAPEIPAAQQEILDKINELEQDLEELTK